MSARTPTAAVGLFRDFLDANGLTAHEAARALGVSHVAVSHWLHLTSRPTAHLREAISVWSRGHVPIEAWLQDEEREQLREMRPFVPKGAA